MAAPQALYARSVINYEDFNKDTLLRIAKERNINSGPFGFFDPNRVTSGNIIAALIAADARDATWLNKVARMSTTYDPTITELGKGLFEVFMKLTKNTPPQSLEQEFQLRTVIYKIIMKAPADDIERYLDTLPFVNIMRALESVYHMGFIANVGASFPYDDDDDGVTYTRINNFSLVTLPTAKELLSKRDFQLLSESTKVEIFNMQYGHELIRRCERWSENGLPDPCLPKQVVMSYLFNSSEENRLRIINHFGIRRIAQVDPIEVVYRMSEDERKLALENDMVFCLCWLDKVMSRNALDRPLRGKTFAELSAMTYTDKTDYLDMLTDVELENLMEIGDELTTDRASFIRSSTDNMSHRPTYFYYKYRGSRSRAVNQRETISLTNLDDPNTFFVAYGNFNRYYIYELQDLIDAAYVDTETGVFRLRRPENPAESFTSEDFRGLMDLLDTLFFNEILEDREEEIREEDVNNDNIYDDEDNQPRDDRDDQPRDDRDDQPRDHQEENPQRSPTEEVAQQAARLNSALAYMRDRYREQGALLSQADRARVERLQNIFADYEAHVLNQRRNRNVAQEFIIVNEKSLVSEFLHQIFITGMYMRRWKGPGNPYPLRTADTRCESDPEPIVQANLAIAQAILDRMSEYTLDFCMNLPIVQYLHNGALDVEDNPFSREWNNVVASQQCIRMASSKFVGTAVYYLRQLFNETIPGMENARVDRIQ
jgi:hypothetical protein